LIDLFTLALTHGLILLALWRLLFRPELDVEDAPAGPRKPWLKEAEQPAGPETVDRGPGDA
jgi:hypothetical protein